MNRRAPACCRRALACCCTLAVALRRASACCCTLAVLIAAALPAAAASGAITHRCSNALFRYTERYPIGYFGWHYDIPPEYIPGGTSPSNAVTRLTADTRLAFVGAFDGYFRRLLASTAFGTAECTNITVGAIGGTAAPLRLQSAADWIDDNTITNVFGNTNFWYLATNRDYAVTNITVTATNWIGYATNIVYNPAGKPVGVKIENRYDVTTTNILDTTRILRRYLRDHDAMRVKIDNPIRGMMVSTGSDENSNPAPEPWPNRNVFYFGGSPASLPAAIVPDDFLGWSFTAVADPYLAPSAEWQPSLYAVFSNATASAGGSFAGFFPTTWDLFGAQNSRDAIARDLKFDGDAKYIYYPSVCPEDWDAFVAYMRGGGIAEGYSAMTNLVGVTFTTNTADGLAFLPSQPLTNSTRIAWAPWAGSDAYLALCDTSIAGNSAMPRLRYDVESTGGVATVTYRGAPGDNWLALLTFFDVSALTYRRVYTLTNDTFGLVRDGNPAFANATGERETREDRVELARFDVGNGVSFVVYAETSVEDTADPQVGVNYLQWTMAEAKSWIQQHCVDMQYNPNDGDTFYIFSFDGDSTTLPYFAIGGAGGTSFNARPYYGDYLAQFRGTNVVCTVSIPADQITTRKVMPFDYSISSPSNSIPCLYPNPVYTNPSRGVDEIADIYPTAISAIGITTNPTDVAYLMPETNGYLFAMRSGSHHPLDGPKKVDDFWLDQDDLLADKMGEEVEARAGANPRAPGGILDAFAAEFDQLLVGEGKTLFVSLLKAALAETTEGDGSISIYQHWTPDIFQVSNVRPSSDPQYSWDFDITALEWNEQTSSYTPISPQPQYVRHEWWTGLNENIHTNLDINLSQAAARGRLSGLEAVKWDFKAMHDARATQSSAHLRVLPGGAPAADSPTTQPPNR